MITCKIVLQHLSSAAKQPFTLGFYTQAAGNAADIGTSTGFSLDYTQVSLSSKQFTINTTHCFSFPARPAETETYLVRNRDFGYLLLVICIFIIFKNVIQYDLILKDDKSLHFIYQFY